MWCYIDEQTNPFRAIPQALLARKGREMAQDSEQTYGVTIVAVHPDGTMFTVDLSRTTPARFLEWATVFSIVRCDISSTSDFVCFLGHNPVTLQLIEAFQMRQIDVTALTEMTPDEVFTRMQDLAEATLSASNERIEQLRDVAKSIPAAREELERVEKTAVDVLNSFGYRTPELDDDPLGPPPPSELSDAQRRNIAEEWGDLSGMDRGAEGAWNQLGAARNWDGAI